MMHPAWLSRISRNFPAIFFSMSLAACGGGGSNTDSSGGSATSSTPAPSSNQQAQSGREALAPQPVASASPSPTQSPGSDTAVPAPSNTATGTTTPPAQTGAPTAPAWSITEVAGLTASNQIKDMNDADVIVGVTVDPNETTSALGKIPYQDPFMLKNGQVTSLGNLGGTYGAAIGINGNGQVAGYSYVGSIGQTHAFLYENGAMKDIGKLIGSGGSWAQAINESGQVAIYTNSGVYLYAGGSTHPIPVLGARFLPAAMNDSGQIAGTQLDTATAAFYDGTKLIDFTSLLSKPHSLATGLNNAGQVVGNAYSTAGDDYQGFVYSAGTLRTITAPGSVQSYATSINNAGDVVGAIENTDQTWWAFLYRNSTVIDLNTLPGVTASGWVLTGASKINNAGQILVTGYLNGQSRRGVLTPPP
jgi:probable HAF family extracellular repeat protein